MDCTRPLPRGWGLPDQSDAMSAAENQVSADAAAAKRDRMILVGAVAIVAATLAIDLTTVRGFAAGIVPHVIAIAVTGWMRDKRAPFLVAALASVASMVGFALTGGGNATIIFINRLVLIAAFWVTAWIVFLKQRAAAGLHDANAALEGEVAQRTASLTERTAELETALAARRLAQSALAESEERLRIVTDRLPALVAYVDRDLDYRFVNPRYADQAGTSPGGAVGHAVREVMGEAVFAVVGPLLARAFTGEDVAGDADMPFATGTRTMRYAYVPHRNLSGEVAGVVALLQDVTDERRRTRDLHQAQKMQAVGHLAGGIAHDFNNLLAVIMGNIELAQMRVPNLDPIAPRLDAALTATESGAELARRLLSAARSDGEEGTVLDVRRTLVAMLDRLRTAVGGTIAIETRLAADLWSIVADPALFETVVLNLALNARDAMPDGGALMIQGRNLSPVEVGNGVGSAGPEIALTFADTGIGMTPEVAERAFEPFFTTKEGGRGTGLGLFAVYSFAAAVGGHAAIESAPDKGTTVTLRLPAVVSAAAAAAAPAAPGAVPTGRGETILVVEDNAEVRRLVEGMLESLGYRTVLAADAAAGLAALDHPGPLPDLLLSDVILTGGVTGFQLADKARARHPGLRTVFMSGYTADAERAGVDRPLLRKPFRKDDLARFVRRALDAPPPE